MSKRGLSPPASSAVIKRSRNENDGNTQQLVISSAGDDKSKGLVRTVKRTSNLEAPIISLAGAHAVRLLSFFVVGELAERAVGRDSFVPV